MSDKRGRSTTMIMMVSRTCDGRELKMSSNGTIPPNVRESEYEWCFKHA